MKGISKTLTKLVYTSKQREALELFFLSLPMSPLEERQRIEELSETTGLSRDQIKMWIRNRRNRGAYKGRVNLAIEQVSVLEWIFINITTYPSVSLKHLLASELDIRYDQIQKWFETRRLRGPPAILSRASNMDEEEWQRTVQRIHELVLLSKTDENENSKRKGGITHSSSNPLSPKRKNRGDSPEIKIFKRSRVENSKGSSSSSQTHRSPGQPNPHTPPESPNTRSISDASFPAATNSFFADSPFAHQTPIHTPSLANSQPLPLRCFEVGFQTPPQQQPRGSLFQPTTPDFQLQGTNFSPNPSPTNLPPSQLGSPGFTASGNYHNPFLSPPLPPLSTLVSNLHLSGSNGALQGSGSAPPMSCNSPTPQLPGMSSPIPPTSPFSPASAMPTSPLGSTLGSTPSPVPAQDSPGGGPSAPLPLLAPWRPYLSSSNGFFE